MFVARARYYCLLPAVCCLLPAAYCLPEKKITNMFLSTLHCLALLAQTCLTLQSWIVSKGILFLLVVFLFCGVWQWYPVQY